VRESISSRDEHWQSNARSLSQDSEAFVSFPIEPCQNILGKDGVTYGAGSAHYHTAPFRSEWTFLNHPCSGIAWVYRSRDSPRHSPILSAGTFNLHQVFETVSILANEKTPEYQEPTRVEAPATGSPGNLHRRVFVDVVYCRGTGQPSDAQHFKDRVKLRTAV